MGMAKRLAMEVEERGWEIVTKVVCQKCVNHHDVWRLANAEVSSGRCSYCKRSPVKIKPVRSIQEMIFGAIDLYYADPVNACAPYFEGEWKTPLYSVDEVLDHLGFDGIDALRADIAASDQKGERVRAANGSWADEQIEDRLGYSWSSFTQVIKHQTRFNFQTVPAEKYEQEVPVSEMLNVVGTYLQRLVRTVDAHTPLFRARHLNEAEAARATSEMMGPPPKEIASAGRMNPAGIPYFYCAFDAQTALAEVGAQAESFPTVAVFHNTRALRVVDLFNLPSIPSPFATDLRTERGTARFLDEFVRSITRPVTKDGAEHISYVPSQVVCEYIAQAFLADDGRRVDGLIYPSAVHPGGANLLVFPSGKWFMPDRFPDLAFERLV